MRGADDAAYAAGALANISSCARRRNPPRAERARFAEALNRSARLSLTTRPSRGSEEGRERDEGEEGRGETGEGEGGERGRGNGGRKGDRSGE
eukprot:1252870-Pyramimonas_sp.AAC.1